MARARTRNYTSELSRITTKALKSLLNSSMSWQITSKGLKLIAQVQDHHITYQLANEAKVLGRLDKTALSYGWRHWFICPHCHNRKAMLYYTSKQIACRECFNLHYPTQSENKLDRLRHKIIKKRDLLFRSNDREYNDHF